MLDLRNKHAREYGVSFTWVKGHNFFSIEHTNIIFKYNRYYLILLCL